MSRRIGNAKTILIVPCFNESKRLPTSDFTDFLADHPDVVIVFVNDGSTDSTHASLSAIQDQIGFEQVHVMSLDRNGGKGEAIRQGMQFAISPAMQDKYQPVLIGYLDADLATSLVEFQRLIDIALRRVDITLVVGSRLSLKGHHVKRTLSRKYLGRIFSIAVFITLRIGLKDTQCGAKVFRNGKYLSELFKDRFSDRWLFDVEIITRLQAIQPGEIYECPLENWRDVGGSRLRIKDLLIAPWKLCMLAYSYRIKPAYRRLFRSTHTPLVETKEVLHPTTSTANSPQMSTEMWRKSA